MKHDSRWRDPKKEPPEGYGPCLVTMDVDGEMSVRISHREYVREFREDYLAWMPFPDPWQGKQAETLKP